MLVETGLLALSLVGAPLWAIPHLPEAVGLWARGRRQRDKWAPHLERTRAAILRAADEVPEGRRTVAVLGSGPLFDVPLAGLAEKFDRVLLVDRAYLMPARLQARQHLNVRCLWRDLADPGAVAALADEFPLSWVLSLNLLSQLGHGAPDGSERTVIDAHLCALADLPCPATLITDTGYEVRDRAGLVVERFDLLHGRKLPAPAESWMWEVAPFGEEAPDRARIHRVAVYPRVSAISP